MSFANLLINPGCAHYINLPEYHGIIIRGTESNLHKIRTIRVIRLIAQPELNNIQLYNSYIIHYLITSDEVEEAAHPEAQVASVADAHSAAVHNT